MLKFVTLTFNDGQVLHVDGVEIHFDSTKGKFSIRRFQSYYFSNWYHYSNVASFTCEDFFTPTSEMPF